MLSAECSHTFIVAYMADPFMSQVPGTLFTVSSETFSSIIEESDKALALSWRGKKKKIKNRKRVVLHFVYTSEAHPG